MTLKRSVALFPTTTAITWNCVGELEEQKGMVARLKEIQSRNDPKGNPIVSEYVLPNYSEGRHGRVKQKDEILTDTEQVLVMNNERFAVPEVLFRPSDVGETSSVSSRLRRNDNWLRRSDAVWAVSYHLRFHILLARGRSGSVLGKYRADRRQHENSRYSPETVQLVHPARLAITDIRTFPA